MKHQYLPMHVHWNDILCSVSWISSINIIKVNIFLPKEISDFREKLI